MLRLRDTEFQPLPGCTGHLQISARERPSARLLSRRQMGMYCHSTGATRWPSVAGQAKVTISGRSKQVLECSTRDANIERLIEF